jgi:hypothetical protein
MNPYTFLGLFLVTGIVLSIFHAQAVNRAQRSANRHLEDAIYAEWGKRMAYIEKLMLDPDAVENIVENMKTMNPSDGRIDRMGKSYKKD